MASDENIEHQFFLISPGPRPPFGEVVDHVYGRGSDVDMEGNSATPKSVDWTWLYMALRPRNSPLVEIFPWKEDATVLCVSSEDEALARKTVEYLHQRCGGTIEPTPPAKC
jgi:hypothetical protein